MKGETKAEKAGFILGAIIAWPLALYCGYKALLWLLQGLASLALPYR